MGKVKNWINRIANWRPSDPVTSAGAVVVYEA